MIDYDDEIDDYDIELMINSNGIDDDDDGLIIMILWQ